MDFREVIYSHLLLGAIRLLKDHNIIGFEIYAKKIISLVTTVVEFIQ